MSSTTFQTPKVTTPQIVLGLVGAALIAAFLYLFHGGIENLFRRWQGSEELSHSYFIPLIAAWMLWDRREALQGSLGKPSLLALPLFAFGVFMVFALKNLHVFVLEHIGLLVALIGVPLLIGGRSLLKVSIIPILYLAFMIPPPKWFITVSSWKFQMWSSELGVAMLQLFDIPVLLSGNVIELSNITLQVVEACAGLNYLFPFLSLAAVAAYFYRGPIWQRILVVLSAIPITIFMNSFRIAVTGYLSENFGPEHTEGFLHAFEGFVIFALCIVVLLTLLVTMARLSGRKNVLSGLGLPDIEPVTPKKAWDRQFFVKLGAGTAVAIALSALAVHSVKAPLNYPDRAPFTELALEFPGWEVNESRLDVATERVLRADDYVVLNLENPEGESFNFYTAYLNQQRNGSSWHSPAQCLPGGGWQFLSNEIVSNEGVEGLSPYHYNRIIMKQGQERVLVYYWYQQRGRKIANEFVMKGWLIFDVLSQRRSDGAMIRLMTRIDPDGTVEEADERLQGFQLELEDRLDRYIPT